MSDEKQDMNLKKPKDSYRMVYIFLGVVLVSLLIAIGISYYALRIMRDKINAMDTETEEALATEGAAPSEEATQTAEETEAVPQTITISLAGDCSLGRLQIHGYEGSFWEYYDTYGKDYFFQNVQDYFANDSMTLVNFEGVLTESDERVEKTFNIKGRPEFIDVLPAASIECVTFGNNHRIDYGEQGIEDTVSLFEANDITYAYNEYLGVYTTPEGVTVGYVSATAFEDPETEAYLLDGVAELKEEGVDIILACCHWGIEKDYYPCDYQTELGHKLIDAGADLVVGCHPHVLQGFEYYNGHYIIYSLGNFCFGGNMNPSDKNTMIVSVQFTVTDGEQTAEPVLTAVPCRLSGHDGYNDYCPYVAEGDTRENILSLLNEYSAPYGVGIGEDGVLYPLEETGTE